MNPDWNDSIAVQYKGTPTQGWQCPICGKIYAPHVGECSSCNSETLHFYNDSDKSKMFLCDFKSLPHYAIQGPSSFCSSIGMTMELNPSDICLVKFE